MSILISIVLVVLFFLLLYWLLMKSIPSDESKPLDDALDRLYKFNQNDYVGQKYSSASYSNTQSNQQKKKLNPFSAFPDSVQNEREQQSRMVKAHKDNLYIFPDTFDGSSAFILGSEGNVYKTSFISCACMDFQKRKLPCKHMYKLAFWSKKMNLYDWGIKLEGLKIQNRKPTKKELESIKHSKEIDRERQEAYIKEWRTRWGGYNLDSVYAKEQFMASYRLDGMYLIDNTFDDSGNDTVYMDIPREYDNSKSYIVTLSSCTCKDFRHTKEPCRHMYLLATEIGVISPKITINDIERNTIIDECFENLQEELIHGD